jgi:hypothetical protein
MSNMVQIPLAPLSKRVIYVGQQWFHGTREINKMPPENFPIHNIMSVVLHLHPHLDVDIKRALEIPLGFWWKKK